MSKKDVFIEYVRPLFDGHQPVPKEAEEYWQALITEPKSNKPLFTENGKLILQFLKDNQNIDNWKAKDIAEAIGISSRSVSGSARKLVNDGYLEKVGKEPTYYCLTEQGKECNFENENEGE